jgi:hypothetical protein
MNRFWMDLSLRWRRICTGARAPALPSAVFVEGIGFLSRSVCDHRTGTAARGSG